MYRCTIKNSPLWSNSIPKPTSSLQFNYCKGRLIMCLNALTNRPAGYPKSKSSQGSPAPRDPIPNQLHPTCPETLPMKPCNLRRYANFSALYFSSVSFASIILFPAMPFTFSIRPPSLSRASISSPPPMLLPLMSTFGTVRLPVLFSSAACNREPNGCVSSSTTYGAGTMVYFSNSMRFALAE